MKLNEGIRTEERCVVTVDGRPLDPRYDLRNHSPTGFKMGYGGSGPAQLALVLLTDALGNDELAQRRYQHFKRERIATTDGDRFLMTQAEIQCWLADVLNTAQW